MKAWVLHGINDIRFETKEKPALAPGEVLVNVKAAGICGSDIPRIYKTGRMSIRWYPGMNSPARWLRQARARIRAGLGKGWAYFR